MNACRFGLISLGAPITGCTVVEEDDDADFQLQADDLEDDDHVEVEMTTRSDPLRQIALIRLSRRTRRL